MMKFYSALTNGFYAPEINGSNMPGDVIEIEDGEYLALLSAQGGGAEIKPGENGNPVSVAPPSPTLDDIRASALAEIIDQRAPILSALVDIGFDAMVAGDTATVQAVAAARNALKIITSDAGFLAATTYAGMKVAILTRYREIAVATPPAVQAAFAALLS